MAETFPRSKKPRLAGSTIVATPGIAGGYPRVRNTRIAVRSILVVYRQTGSIEQTEQAFPQLTAAQVRAALAYYDDHPGGVDEDLESNEAAIEEIQSRQ